jgi:hypothetical protein
LKKKSLNVALGSECLDRYASRIVPHTPDNADPLRDPVDPRSKSNPLNRSANFDSSSGHHGPSSATPRTYATTSHFSSSLNVGHAGIDVPRLPSLNTM